MDEKLRTLIPKLSTYELIAETYEALDEPDKADEVAREAEILALPYKNAVIPSKVLTSEIEHRTY